MKLFQVLIAWILSKQAVALIRIKKVARVKTVKKINKMILGNMILVANSAQYVEAFEKNQ